MNIFRRIVEFARNGMTFVEMLDARISHIEAWLEQHVCNHGEAPTAPAGPAAPVTPPAPAAQNGGAS